MKRQIKFRAMCDYDEASGMVYFQPAECDNGVFCMPNPNNIHHIDEYISPLMQFTGLLDEVDAKEIWEGDIIEYMSCGVKCKAIIVWNEGCGTWQYKYPNMNNHGVTDFLYKLLGNSRYPAKVKVIGNKYENPELAKS